MMTGQMLPSVLPTYALMGFSLLQTMAILMPCMLIHALVNSRPFVSVSEQLGPGKCSSAALTLRLPRTLTLTLL